MSSAFGVRARTGVVRWRVGTFPAMATSWSPDEHEGERNGSGRRSVSGGDPAVIFLCGGDLCSVGFPHTE